MSEEVSHKGVVRSVKDGVAFVEIVSESACGSCAAAGLCTAAEARKKIVEVSAGDFSVGDSVEVVLSSSMGLRAAILCYFVPIVVFLAVTLLALAHFGELVSASFGLLSLGLYYLIIYMFRKRLDRSYRFVLRKN